MQLGVENISLRSYQTVNSTTLYLISGVLFMLGAALFFVIILSGQINLVTAVSVLFGCASAVFAIAAKFQADERDRAFKFLTESSSNQDLMNSMNFVGRILNKNAEIEIETAKNIYFSQDSRDKEFIRNIFNVYNFFEVLAIAIVNKQVNERILREYYAGSTCRFISSTKIFIPVLRNFPETLAGHPWGNRSRPDMFVFALWLFDKWQPYYESYFPTELGTHYASWAPNREH